jgi:hypothetical protein
LYYWNYWTERSQAVRERLAVAQYRALAAEQQALLAARQQSESLARQEMA